MTKILLLTLLFADAVSLLAQIDTTRKEFFPLQVGNTWQYSTENNQLVTVVITNDTIIDGKQYYVFYKLLQYNSKYHKTDLFH